jgi:hypothetical protein
MTGSPITILRAGDADLVKFPGIEIDALDAGDVVNLAPRGARRPNRSYRDFF